MDREKLLPYLILPLVISILTLSLTSIHAAEIRLGGILPGGALFNKKLVSMREHRYVNIVPQSTDFSCGAATLATILKFAYSKNTSEHQVLEGLLKVSDSNIVKQRGFSLLDIKRYVTVLGMQGRGFKMNIEKLNKIKVPVIVLLDIKGYKHFVVLKKTTAKKVYIADPALGNKIMKTDDFIAAWNGIIFAVIGKNYDSDTVLSRPAEALSAKRLHNVFAPVSNLNALDFGIIQTRYF